MRGRSMFTSIFSLVVTTSALAQTNHDHGLHVPTPTTVKLQPDATRPPPGRPIRDEELIEPPVISSQHGVLDTVLTVKPATVTVADRTFTSNVFNGQYLAPVLRVRRGDLVHLRLVNESGKADIEIEAPLPTNLHYHGMAIPPAAPADDVFIKVPPAENAHPGHATNSYEYHWRVPRNHPLGLHWYHPHVHGSVEKSVLSGLSGLLIVDDLITTHYPELVGLKEQTLFLRDIALPDASDGDPKTKTINGQSRPVIRIRPGEHQLWRMGNVGADAFFDFAVDGHQLVAIAHDANLLENPDVLPSLYLPPGARSEAVIVGGKPGRYAIRSRAVDTGPAGDPNPDVVIGTLIVEGKSAQQKAIDTRLAAPPVGYDTVRPNPDQLATLPITRKRTITFSESADGNTFFINGNGYDEGRNDVTVTEGDVEEWTILNTTGERHVFHIHQLDFLVTAINGQTLDYEGLRDVIDIPIAQGGVPGSATIVIPFTNPDIVGKFVFHCHILEHEDNGMMANIVVLPK